MSGNGNGNGNKRFLLYVIQNGKDNQTFWNRAGVAFQNKDLARSTSNSISSRRSIFSFASRRRKNSGDQ